MRAFCILIVGVVLVGGCASSPTVSRFNPNHMPGNIATELSGTSALAASPAMSLFGEDQAVISNAELANVLAQKISVAPGSKMAVVRVGNLPYWWGWSESFVRMNQKIDSDFLGRLASNKRVHDVSYLPSMVMPPRITIPLLRQAAARCQADLLLVYRTNISNYTNEKLFAPGETKAYCTVEAIVLDTRSGIILHSAVVTEGFSAKKTRDDIDFNETVAKANQQAIANAWLGVADAVNAYFDSLPEAPARAAAPQTLQPQTSHIE